jgi:type II secretory pathway pseudopilin PulG
MATKTANNKRSENGMTLFAVLAVMAVFAIGLLAVAPTVQQEVQREKELEAIHRGEEVAEALRQYVEFYRGAKLPQSMDDLLEGLPQGTKKRQILRASAAVDPLSEDGKWRLIKADVNSLGPFAKRVQEYNGGVLPSNPSQIFDRYALVIVNSVNTGSEDDKKEADDESDFDVLTEDTPFIGVASQSRSKSVIAYYGIENHSKWIFTPLFRGSGKNVTGGVVPGASGGLGGGTGAPPGSTK